MRGGAKKKKFPDFRSPEVGISAARAFRQFVDSYSLYSASPLKVTNAKICNGNWTEWSTIPNGNRTEWSPIRSVIIRVIKQIARALTRTVQLLRHNAYTVQLHCPVNAQIMAGGSQSDSRILS